LIPLTRWHHGAKSEQRTQAAGNDIYCENASSTSHVPRQFFDLSRGKGCGIGAGVDDYEAVKNSTGKIPRYEKRNAHLAQGVNDSRDTFTWVGPIQRDLERKQLRESGGGVGGALE